MWQIIENVSGKSLKRFGQENIFGPLGMKNTHFHDDNTHLIKNRAFSYYRKDSLEFGNMDEGATSRSELQATVLDIARGIHEIRVRVTRNYDPSQFTTQYIDNVTLSGEAAVPEPSTLGMLLVGLVGIGAALRRRRSS